MVIKTMDKSFCFLFFFFCLKGDFSTSTVENKSVPQIISKKCFCPCEKEKKYPLSKVLIWCLKRRNGKNIVVIDIVFSTRFRVFYNYLRIIFFFVLKNKVQLFKTLAIYDELE